MVDRTGQNALFAFSDGTNRRTAPPVPTGSTSSTWPRLAAYLQGSTTFPMSATEIANRALNAWQIWMNPVVGLTAASYSTAIAAVKAANPGTDIYAYTIPQELPTTKPGGVYGTLWQFATDANFWARGSWPSSALIDMGGGFSMMNESVHRSFNGKTWNVRYIDAVIGDMALPVSGVLTDDTSPNAFSGFDWNEDGITEGGSSASMQSAYIAGMQARHDYLVAQGKKYGENGAIGWWIDHVNGQNYISQLSGIFHAHVYEMLAGNYRIGTATSFGRVFYAPSPGQIPNLNQVLTWPGGATVSSAPPIGTLLQLRFGGWTKDFAGTNIYTKGELSLNCWRAALEWAANHLTSIDPDHLCVQVLGPAPARFNNPNGTTGAWAWADRHARAVTLSTAIFTNFYVHYVAMEQTPSTLGVQIILDEFRVNWGTPVTTNLGQPQFGINWGSGVGNGWQNGVYVRQWSSALAVFNPVGNGQQTITLPPSPTGNWRHIQPSDWSGSVAQATVNDGTTVNSAAFVIAEHDAYLLVAA